MKILSRPKGNAEEYGRWAVNAYLGCPNECSYCYLKKGPGAKNLGGSAARLKAHIVNAEHAYHIAMTEIIENQEQIKKDGGLFFTFTSDPCLPETRHLTFTIVWEAVNRMHIPVTILTKDATLLYLGEYEKTLPGITTDGNWRHPIPFQNVVSERLNFIENPLFDSVSNLIKIGFTLTGHDELEPNASPNVERIKAMQTLKEMNFDTWASIEPVVDFPSAYEMVRQALDAGCRHLKIGLMTKNTKVCRKGFSFGGHDFAPYDPAECLAFVQDVMTLTRDRATVYWKQSFREFIGGTPAHRLFKDDELHKIFDDYPNAVGKDYSMFKND